MSIWDNLAKEAEKGTGGDWPEIEDDLYPAVVQAVSEPTDEPDRYKPGEMKTQFFITWELRPDDSQAELPEGTTLRQYITLPNQYLNDGYLNEKSWCYKTMQALGYDMESRFRVDPREWIGKRARIMVENKVPEKGGDARPRITDVKPIRAKAGAK